MRLWRLCHQSANVRPGAGRSILSNEYIYTFGDERKPASESLVLSLVDQGIHDVRVVRLIIDEVLRNLPRKSHRRFFEALDLLLEEDCGIDEEFVIPYHRGEHFREVGFKEADASIAAYAEAVGADVVVSENRRHFHAMAGHLPFRVMDAETFLKRRA